MYINVKRHILILATLQNLNLQRYELGVTIHVSISMFHYGQINQKHSGFNYLSFSIQARLCILAIVSRGVHTEWHVEQTYTFEV